MINNNLLENIQHHTENKSFSLHRTEVDPSYTNALYVHYHPEMEFLYLAKGSMSFFFEGRCIEMKPGEAVFVPPYIVHNSLKGAGSECEYSAVVFSEEWLFGSSNMNEYTRPIYENRYECCCHIMSSNSHISSVNNASSVEDMLSVDNVSSVVITTASTVTPHLLEILSHIHTYKNQPLESFELKLKGELLICFQYLYSTYFSKSLSAAPITSSAYAIQSCLTYINEHFSEDYSLDTLSEKFGYSPSHFEHSFKDITGSTPFVYINRIRIIKASEMLKSTDKKITDIAAECGYSNISYFNRTFKKIMGVSPKEYRSM